MNKGVRYDGNLLVEFEKQMEIAEKTAGFKRKNKKVSYSAMLDSQDYTRIRVGMGYDVHRLVEGRDLWLGGIKVEHSLGLDGHSDADVLIHAICDALLGAANMRDIGYHFPDNSNQYLNIDSKILLRKTVELIESKGYQVGNIDATICAERPKLNPFIPQMQQCMADVIGIDAEDISIKATTTEKLGFTGREEGMSAYAVVLIQKD